jgi:putative membrane protein
MKEYIGYILKGLGVGIANIIPGVSGGTIALITGIFVRLINAIKSFDLRALKLLLSGKVKTFAEKTDLYFLIAVFSGVVIAIVLLAKIFGFLFDNYPVYIWSYFFGLVMASIYFVGKRIDRWTIAVIVFLTLGTAIAVVLSFFNPATQNESIFYLFLCGVVAVCSMILPGLSGSFVLILMGNYQLVAIEAINNRDLGILIPVVTGAIVGLIAFSHLLSWVFKHFKDQTIALLTGFILGSLNVLWPWKKATYLTNETGDFILKDGEKIVARYASILPESMNTEVWVAILLVVIGIISITALELTAIKEEQPTN